MGPVGAVAAMLCSRSCLVSLGLAVIIVMFVWVLAVGLALALLHGGVWASTLEEAVWAVKYPVGKKG